MPIRYTTSDGKSFETAHEAEAHEANIAHLGEMKDHIDAMLDEKGITHQAQRTKAHNIIEAWESYRALHDVPLPVEVPHQEELPGVGARRAA